MGQRLSEESDPDKEIDVAELQEWYKKFVESVWASLAHDKNI